MKFEQLLQVYWSKGFLYSGKLHSFNVTLPEFLLELRGFGPITKLLFLRRFELLNFFKTNKNLISLRLEYRKIINMYISQLVSISESIDVLLRYNLIRLYLIKSFRGRAQALGKPSRGQRTWSNGQNAYKCNRLLRLFISEVLRNNVIKKEPEKLNFKRLKRKFKKTPTKYKMLITVKKLNTWF